MGRISKAAITMIVFLLFGSPLLAEQPLKAPGEYGVYIKTNKSLQRLMPNILFNQEGLIFVESNNPPHFSLRDVEYIVINGTYDTGVLTMNHLLFFQSTPLGKQRYIIGKDVPITIKQQGKNLYQVKSKGLLGRGYFCVWIEDTVWDFIVE